MPVRALIDDLDKWQRVGRGRSLQFFATDEEVQNWVNTALPRKYAPYALLGADNVKEGRVYVDQPFRCEVSALLHCQRASAASRYNFWVWSEVLTPDLPFQRSTWLNMLCSTNGLVLLQHGLMLRDFRDRTFRGASSIGVPSYIRHIETGEERRYDGYLEIYKALHKVISKALVYSSLETFPGGIEEEDTRLQRMTAGAVRAYYEGVPFRNKPGRLLSKVRGREGASRT